MIVPRAFALRAASLAATLCVLGACSDDDSVGRGLNDDGAGGGLIPGAGVGGSGDGGEGASGGGGGEESGSAGGAGGGGAGAGCPGGATCVDALPFQDQRDTATEGAKLIDSYACKPEADESGPEIAYLIEVPSDGTLTATVTDGDGVDIDVHILEALDGEACLARDDVSASAAVTAGSVWVVADTYVSGGVPQSGSFEIDISLE